MNRQSPHETIASGTKGIIAYKGKLLLVLRDNKPDIPFPNTWEYVGGAKEAGETFEEAGLREMEEEFGIRPKNYTFLGIEIYPGREAGRFIAILDDEEHKMLKFENEGVKYDFFTIEESIELDMAPNLKTFLMKNKDVLKEIIENYAPINVDRFKLAK